MYPLCVLPAASPPRFLSPREGERVAKKTAASASKLYFGGSATAPELETDAGGTMTAEYIFFDGKRVGQISFRTGGGARRLCDERIPGESCGSALPRGLKLEIHKKKSRESMEKERG